MASKDKSWSVPDTTAFKNIKPDYLPKSTYVYKGDVVGNQGNLPIMGQPYKGEGVGKGKNLPNMGKKHKGDKVGTGKNTEN